MNLDEEFRKKYNYTTPLKEILQILNLLNNKFVNILHKYKKKNAGEYKAKIIKQAIDTIDRNLVKFLQFIELTYIINMNFQIYKLYYMVK